MGQAKKRGTFEQRRIAAVARDAERRAQAAALEDGRRLLAEARERHRSSEPVQRFVLPATRAGRALQARLLAQVGLAPLLAQASLGHLVTR